MSQKTAAFPAARRITNNRRQTAKPCYGPRPRGDVFNEGRGAPRGRLDGFRLAGGRSDRARRGRPAPRRRLPGLRAAHRLARHSRERRHPRAVCARERARRAHKATSTPSPPGGRRSRRTGPLRRSSSTSPRTQLDVSESQLAVLVRALYERPDQGDPLAVLLSAESLDEALAGLDSLSRAAGQNNRIIEQAREARKQLAAVAAQLAAQATELDATRSRGRAASAARLAATAAARRSFVGGPPASTGPERRAHRRDRGPGADGRATVGSDLAFHAAARNRCRRPGVRSFDRRERTADNHRQLHRVLHSGPHIDRHADGRGRRRGRSSVIPLGTRLTIPGYGTASRPTPAARCTET